MSPHDEVPLAAPNAHFPQVPPPGYVKLPAIDARSLVGIALAMVFAFLLYLHLPVRPDAPQTLVISPEQKALDELKSRLTHDGECKCKPKVPAKGDTGATGAVPHGALTPRKEIPSMQMTHWTPPPIERGAMIEFRHSPGAEALDAIVTKSGRALSVAVITDGYQTLTNVDGVRHESDPDLHRIAGRFAVWRYKASTLEFLKLQDTVAQIAGYCQALASETGVAFALDPFVPPKGVVQARPTARPQHRVAESAPANLDDELLASGISGSTSGGRPVKRDDDGKAVL